MSDKDLSVVIPTFGRNEVLVQTIRHILSADPAPSCIIVIDQTPTHTTEVREQLNEWVAARKIQVAQQEPSIPRAMNRGLREACSEFVLFLDDDVIPVSNLMAAHLSIFDNNVCAVVGQVLQPGEEPVDREHRGSVNGLNSDMDFCFRSTHPSPVTNVMAGNLSVNRELALRIGGFDENYVGVAYRFETDFAKRLSKVGKIMYAPDASIRHLRAPSGGTRTWGNHLTSHRPEHSVGDYYFSMRHGRPIEAFQYRMRRLFTSVATRFHATHPWWIPPKLIGELRGWWWARQLAKRGPKLIQQELICQK
jgi:GT2 family glycosyltransferase